MLFVALTSTKLVVVAVIGDLARSPKINMENVK
jgi:hypothetical protein